jgi:2'-5' RNA ligase
MSEPEPQQHQPPDLPRVRNHWWWRPGWRTGRHFYACHLITEGQPQLGELVGHYQAALANIPGLDLIPKAWLHITTQGIGFADEISTADLTSVRKHLTERLRDLEPPVVTSWQPAIWEEAVVLKAIPQEPLYQLRIAMHDAVAAALGPAKFSEPWPAPDQFTPHLSVAYASHDGPGEPIAEALRTVTADAVITFGQAFMLEFHRDKRMYEWTQATPIPIGKAPAET